MTEHVLSQQQQNVLNQELKHLANVRPIAPHSFVYENTAAQNITSDQLFELAGALTGYLDVGACKPASPLDFLKNSVKKVIAFFVKKIVVPRFAHQVTVNQYLWNVAAQVLELQKKVEGLEYELSILRKKP